MGPKPPRPNPPGGGPPLSPSPRGGKGRSPPSPPGGGTGGPPRPPRGNPPGIPPPKPKPGLGLVCLSVTAVVTKTLSPQMTGDEDRKSTRLNSSHVASSY